MEYLAPAQLWDTSNKGVRYVFPPSLRSVITRQLLLYRLKQGMKTMGTMAFAFLRISFGVILLLSLCIILILVIVVVVIMASQGEGHGGGGHGLPLFDMAAPRRRHYRGNDLSDLYWCCWW